MKKSLKLFTTLLAILVLIYSGGWFFLAQKVTKEINQFYETDGPSLGYVFHGDEPSLSGFPFKPVVTYKKGFSRGDLNIQFEKLSISAIPHTGQPLNIKIDNLAIQNTPSGQLYEIDNVEAVFIIPEYLPPKMTRPQLAAWKEDVEMIEVKSLRINKNSMYIKALGFVGLDNNLQPNLNLNTLVADYDKLLHFMSVETSEIKPLTAKILLSAFNAMAETDEESGDKFIRLNVKINDRRLIAGPIKTIVIPEISWPETL